MLKREIDAYEAITIWTGRICTQFHKQKIIRDSERVEKELKVYIYRKKYDTLMLGKSILWELVCVI